MLTKQATLLRRGTWAENRRIRDPRGAALLHGSVSGFMVMGLVVSGQSFWLKVLFGGAHVAQPRRMPARRFLGDW